MKTHFNQFMNIKRLLTEFRPRHVLELGALEGENTQNLLGIMPDLGFKLTVISDDLPDQAPEGVTYMKGVSYRLIEELPDHSIDFALLDTDHNHWTFQKEMVALHPKLTFGATVLIHDVDTFYYDTGIADGYGDGSVYPLLEIENAGRQAGSLGTSLIDFLANNRWAYRLISWLQEGNGCAMIRKNPETYQINFLKACEGKGRRAACSA